MSRSRSTAGAGGAWRLAFVPLLGLCWGLNWPAVKIMLGEIQPWTLRAGGLLMSGLLLATITKLRGDRLAVPPRHWPRLLAAGVLSIAAFSILLAFAQNAAPTSRAAIVTYTMPVWAALFAWIVLGEPFDRTRVVGLTLGVAGLAALGWPLVRDGQLSIGLLYALLGGMSWAAGTVVLKRFPIAAAPMATAAWQLLIGGACCTVGMLIVEGVPVPHPLSGAVILSLVFHVLFAQASGYVIWFEVVGRLPAGISALGTLMVPAVGVLGAMLFVGERPTIPDYCGLVLIIAAAASIALPARPVRAAVPYATGGAASGN